MKIYEGNLGENRIPTLYEFEKLFCSRMTTGESNHQRELKLKSLENGVTGENMALDYIKRNVPDEWSIIRNLWVNYQGLCEFDLILVTEGNQIYVFEVKNYSGTFSYQEGECKVNGRVITSNCVEQAKKAQVYLQAICRKISPDIRVTGVLVFISADNWIEINSEVKNLQILMRNQFQIFLKDIVKNNKAALGQRNMISSLLYACQQYNIENPFTPQPLNPKEISQLRKGMCCDSCQSFDLVIQTHTVSCRHCGFIETKEKTVLRTIHEYGVLTHNQHLTMGALLEFFNHQIHRNVLRRILTKYFDKVGNGRSTNYLNKKISFSVDDYPELK